jgi:hypothetical protein
MRAQSQNCETREASVTKQSFCKNVFTATESRDRRNSHECNNRGTLFSMLSAAGLHTGTEMEVQEVSD